MSSTSSTPSPANANNKKTTANNAAKPDAATTGEKSAGHSSRSSPGGAATPPKDIIERSKKLDELLNKRPVQLQQRRQPVNLRATLLDNGLEKIRKTGKESALLEI